MSEEVEVHVRTTGRKIRQMIKKQSGTVCSFLWLQRLLHGDVAGNTSETR